MQVGHAAARPRRWTFGVDRPTQQRAAGSHDLRDGALEIVTVDPVHAVELTQQPFAAGADMC